MASYLPMANLFQNNLPALAQANLNVNPVPLRYAVAFNPVKPLPTGNPSTAIGIPI